MAKRDLAAEELPVPSPLLIGVIALAVVSTVVWFAGGSVAKSSLIVVGAVTLLVGVPLYFLVNRARRKMVPAAAVQVGHGAWLLLGVFTILAGGAPPGVKVDEVGLLIDLTLDLLFISGSVLMVVYPVMPLVLLLTVYQCCLLAINAAVLWQSGQNPDLIGAMVLHIGLRLIGVPLMFVGLFAAYHTHLDAPKKRRKKKKKRNEGTGVNLPLTAETAPVGEAATTGEQPPATVALETHRRPERNHQPDHRTIIVAVACVSVATLMACGGVVMVGVVTLGWLGQKPLALAPSPPLKTEPLDSRAIRDVVSDAGTRPRPATPAPTSAAEPPPPPPPPPPPLLVPLPEALDIRPASLTKETVYGLPEPAASLRVGGGGRFLILHLPKSRKLGVFDVNELKIVRYISTDEDDVSYAAGMTKLVVYSPGSGLVHRHDLLTGEREFTKTPGLAAGRKLEAFCMGHASAGPLLFSVANDGAGLLNLDTLEPIPVADDSGRRGYDRQPRLRLFRGGNYWAGATGRVFGHTGNYGMPNGVNTLVLEAAGAKEYGEHKGTWYVLPGPDDKHVYAGGHGVVSDRVQPVPNVASTMAGNTGYVSHMYFPAAHGPYYFHAQTVKGFATHGEEEPPPGTVRVFMLGDKEPLATYDNTGVASSSSQRQRGFGIEYRVHLVPRAKLLVVVPDSRDELRLHPADLGAALEKSGRDYLMFTSAPPANFRKGQDFTYRVEASAKAKNLLYRLESGPPGMTCDSGGRVRWAVPAEFASDRVDVILSVKNLDGREAFQTFTLLAAR